MTLQAGVHHDLLCDLICFFDVMWRSMFEIKLRYIKELWVSLGMEVV